MYCEIQPFDVEKSYFDERQPRGVILSGGPETVTSGDTPRIPERLLELEIPILGICYGMQALAAQLGGGVDARRHATYGAIDETGRLQIPQGVAAQDAVCTRQSHLPYLLDPELRVARPEPRRHGAAFTRRRADASFTQLVSLRLRCPLLHKAVATSSPCARPVVACTRSDRSNPLHTHTHNFLLCLSSLALSLTLTRTNATVSARTQ